MAFTIYDEEFYSGMYEVEKQNTALFNEASNNAIRLVPRQHIGDFSKEAFFTEEANLVTRRDITADTDGTVTESDSDELIGVKLYRRFQHEKKLTDIKRIGFTEQEYSFMAGQQIAKAKMVQNLNAGLLALVTALEANGSASFNDITGAGTNTLNYDAIPDTLAKFGDSSMNLVQMIGHSKPIHNLLGDAFTTETENVAGFAIQSGGIPTLNRGLGMTDSPNLIVTDGVSSGVDAYKTLWLVQNALRIEESEEETFFTETVGGKENLKVRIQGEYAITVKVKGFEYTDATANPNDSALGTTGNWAKVATDVKSTAGVYMLSA